MGGRNTRRETVSPWLMRYDAKEYSPCGSRSKSGGNVWRILRDGADAPPQCLARNARGLLLTVIPAQAGIQHSVRVAVQFDKKTLWLLGPRLRGDDNGACGSLQGQTPVLQNTRIIIPFSGQPLRTPRERPSRRMAPDRNARNQPPSADRASAPPRRARAAAPWAFPASDRATGIPPRAACGRARPEAPCPAAGRRSGRRSP